MDKEIHNGGVDNGAETVDVSPGAPLLPPVDFGGIILYQYHACRLGMTHSGFSVFLDIYVDWLA